MFEKGSGHGDKPVNISRPIKSQPGRSGFHIGLLAKSAFPPAFLQSRAPRVRPPLKPNGLTIGDLGDQEAVKTNKPKMATKIVRS